MQHMIHEEIEKGMPHILASPKEEGVVELLLNCGVDHTIKNNNGWTALGNCGLVPFNDSKVELLRSLK